MCYHTSTPDRYQLEKQFPDKSIKYDQAIYYHINGFTRPYLPVTLNNDPLSIIPARWKFIPYWIKSEKDANKYANTLNAVSEEVFEKKTYKSIITTNRGLLYINGFYEPHKNQTTAADENYYIYTPKKEIFTLGILYSHFTDEEQGNTYPTFSILTTAANPLLEKIHNTTKRGARMPLIIPENRREEWLFANEKEKIQSLMEPYKGELNSHRVYRVTGAAGEETNFPEIQNLI